MNIPEPYIGSYILPVGPETHKRPVIGGSTDPDRMPFKGSLCWYVSGFEYDIFVLRPSMYQYQIPTLTASPCICMGSWSGSIPILLLLYTSHWAGLPVALNGWDIRVSICIYAHTHTHMYMILCLSICICINVHTYMCKWGKSVRFVSLQARTCP